MSNELIDLQALEQQMLDVNKQLEELKKQSIETSKKVFHAAIAAFFKAYPEVYAIRWNQYTPYFNDGDTCTFSVGVPGFYTKEDIENEEIEHYEHNCWRAPSKYVYDEVAAGDDKYGYLQHYKDEIAKYEKLEQELGPRLKEIQDGIVSFSKMFNSISDDTMESLFGDHVQVTATANEITVDEYEHD